MALKPYEFWYEYTWAEFQTRLYYHISNKNAEYRTSWEQTRAISQMVISAAGSSVNLSHKWEFEWEKEANRKKWKQAQLSQKEVDNLIKRFSRN